MLRALVCDVARKRGRSGAGEGICYIFLRLIAALARGQPRYRGASAVG